MSHKYLYIPADISNISRAWVTSYLVHVYNECTQNCVHRAHSFSQGALSYSLPSYLFPSAFRIADNILKPLSIKGTMGPRHILISWKCSLCQAWFFKCHKCHFLSSMYRKIYLWDVWGFLRETDKSKGSIVRITPNELHIRDSSFYNEIYAGDSHMRDKSSSFVRFFGVPDSIVSKVDHNHHQLRRKILSKYYFKWSVSNMQPLIQGRMTTQCSILERPKRNKVSSISL